MWGGQDLERGRPGGVWRGWWSAYGEPLVTKSPKLGLSSDLTHLRVWEVGWGNVPLNFGGVLVRESRATWLAGARWGLSPGLYPLVGPL